MQFLPITVSGGISASLPKIYAGRKISEKKIAETIASHVEIVPETPFAYTLDGENYQSGSRLLIDTGPRLQIVVC